MVNTIQTGSNEVSNRGGRREDTGRSNGQGPYGESTVTKRISFSLVPTVKELLQIDVLRFLASKNPM